MLCACRSLNSIATKAAVIRRRLYGQKPNNKDGVMWKYLIQKLRKTREAVKKEEKAKTSKQKATDDGEAKSAAMQDDTCTSQNKKAAKVRCESVSNTLGRGLICLTSGPN